MGQKKKKEQEKTKPFKCQVCTSCKIYIEGPMKDHCIYGGHFGFSGYINEKGEVFSLEELNGQYSKKNKTLLS